MAVTNSHVSWQTAKHAYLSPAELDLLTSCPAHASGLPHACPSQHIWHTTPPPLHADLPGSPTCFLAQPSCLLLCTRPEVQESVCLSESVSTCILAFSCTAKHVLLQASDQQSTWWPTEAAKSATYCMHPDCIRQLPCCIPCCVEKRKEKKKREKKKKKKKRKEKKREE